MSLRKQILQALIDSPNAAVERTIESAILDAGPQEQRELADVLLTRNRRTGWVTLIRVFDRLEEDIRQKLLSRPRDMFGPLSETMQDSEGPARENVINIVRLCSDSKLVYLLAEALMDARPEVRELAGKTLLDTLRRFQQKWLASLPADDTQEIPACDPEIVNQLERAVEFALRHYRKHKQVDALIGALLMERRQDSPMWKYFQDTFEDVTRAATVILRAPSDPALATALLLALGSPLKSAAMAGLANADNPDFIAALVQQSHRLLDPVLHSTAENVGHMKVFLAPRNACPWNDRTWRAWLRMIEGLGLQLPLRLAWLSRLLETAPSGPAGTVWKLTVMQSAVDTGLPEAGELIAPLVNDTDLPVARSAARHLLNKRQHDWRNLAAQVIPASPHLSVRKLVIPFPRRSGLPTLVASTAKATPPEKPFNQVWDEYPKMPPALQVKSTRVSVTEPASAEQLRLKLASSLVADLVQGLKMLNTLPDVSPYRGQIIGLCGHSDARIAGIAVRLIGRLNDPRLKDLLEAAAHHTDARVRANAIESMEALHIADRSQQVLSMLNSRNNRERANAIKAISQFDFFTARECLSRMLADPNPLHRISALWVVSQLKMLETVRQVSSIARRDPNLRVRKRAAEMIETLTGNVPASATREN